MVLERTWQEPLGAISPESLAAEGFPDYAHFRRYWMRRTRKHFKPTRMVVAFRVRAWHGQADAILFGSEILTRLYGEFL